MVIVVLVQQAQLFHGQHSMWDLSLELLDKRSSIFNQTARKEGLEDTKDVSHPLTFVPG